MHVMLLPLYLSLIEACRDGTIASTCVLIFVVKRAVSSNVNKVGL